MTIKRILCIIPFIIAVATIGRCWIEIVTSNTVAQWQHYSALICVAIVVYFYFKSFKHAIIATGAFLLLGTFKGFSMTSDIETTRFGIAGHSSPPFNGLSFGLLFLFLVLNCFSLINLYLDNKERKHFLKTQKQAEIEAGDSASIEP